MSNGEAAQNVIKDTKKLVAGYIASCQALGADTSRMSEIYLEMLNSNHLETIQTKLGQLMNELRRLSLANPKVRDLCEGLKIDMETITDGLAVQVMQIILGGVLDILKLISNELGADRNPK